MKKSRIFSALLVLALLSTCVIGGTFAKYTSTATGKDSARIAKWGFEAPASLTVDLFDDAYTNVKSGDSANVVAPGTSKTATITLATISGTAPEVAYNYGITISMADNATTDLAKLDGLAGWHWTYKKPGAATASVYKTFADLKAAVEADNKNYNAGELPAGYGASTTIELGWEWAFEVGADDAAKATNNAADTAAGNAAAAAASQGLFDITLNVGATQID